MTTLDRICALEARRLDLLCMERRDTHELAELLNITATLAQLWHQRRMEMSGAQHQAQSEYRAHRAGLSSVESKVTRSEGRRNAA